MGSTPGLCQDGHCGHSNSWHRQLLASNASRSVINFYHRAVGATPTLLGENPRVVFSDKYCSFICN